MWSGISKRHREAWPCQFACLASSSNVPADSLDMENPWIDRGMLANAPHHADLHFALTLGTLAACDTESERAKQKMSCGGFAGLQCRQPAASRPMVAPIAWACASNPTARSTTPAITAIRPTPKSARAWRSARRSSSCAPRAATTSPTIAAAAARWTDHSLLRTAGALRWHPSHFELSHRSARGLLSPSTTTIAAGRYWGRSRSHPPPLMRSRIGPFPSRRQATATRTRM